ncbi:MAG TPA: hypothetical protein VLS89_08395 [Candidatus Nanopelagicales bacterium]|nr:hypothetical protein [Candidatus Nanopelagicales bacterium]
MNDRTARILFAYIDGFMSMFSGLFFILAPAAGLDNLVTPALAADIAGSPASLLLVRSFGQLVFGYGLIEFLVVRTGERRVTRLLLLALIVSDLIHIAIYLPFMVTHDVWAPGSVFGLVYEVFMAASRTIYVVRAPRAAKV